jgi:hypothetical protein
MKNMKETIAKPRKVALYASLDSDYCMVDEVRINTHDEHYRALPDGETRERILKGYVRITEPVDVAFSSLTDDSIVQKAVESLDAAEQEAIRELNAKIAAIRSQKAQLLTLTHQSE